MAYPRRKVGLATRIANQVLSKRGLTVLGLGIGGPLLIHGISLWTETAVGKAMRLTLKPAPAYSKIKQSITNKRYTAKYPLIKVEGEKGYDYNKSWAAWDRNVTIWNNTSNKGGTTLHKLLNQDEKYYQWSELYITPEVLMGICDQLWRDERMESQGHYGLLIDAAFGWCIDSSQERK